MAEVSVSSFLLLLILCAPPVQSYPDGGRVVCGNVLDTHNCTKAQTLLKDGLIFVKIDFNDTAKGALSIGGVQPCGVVAMT